MNTNKQPKLNMQEAMELMKRIADKEGLKLTFMKSDEGRGGYNYGGSCGDCIMLAPFVKCGAYEKIDGYSVERPCDNPVECMLISFFHELSHCKLANELSADRSTMQNELWVSMTGLTYAEMKYKLKFSDAAVKWLLNENFSYAKEGGAK